MASEEPHLELVIGNWELAAQRPPPSAGIPNSKSRIPNNPPAFGGGRAVGAEWPRRCARGRNSQFPNHEFQMTHRLRRSSPELGDLVFATGNWESFLPLSPNGQIDAVLVRTDVGLQPARKEKSFRAPDNRVERPRLRCKLLRLFGS